MVDLRTFHQNKTAVRLGDIIYLPETPERFAYTGQLDVLHQRREQLPPELAKRLDGCTSASLAQLIICDEVRQSAWGTAIPAWVSVLPDPFRCEAERECAIHATENPNIVLGFPFSGLGGYVIDLDSTLLGGAYCHFNLQRLAHIRQLAWLTTPVLLQDRPGVIPSRFEHNRLNHCWDVAAVANLLGHGLGLSESEIATLTLAAATHDARTPAGGDTTKILDRAFFDEDANYPELLTTFDAETFLRQCNVDRGTLTQTILGKETLGMLLDIADKTSYVARDAFWFHQRMDTEITDCEEGEAIHHLLRRHPDICNIWHDVTLAKGMPTFTDVEALSRMLMLRVLLFRALYYHPASRFTEFIVAHVVLRHLVDRGALTFRDLLMWRDDELDKRVEVFGHLVYGAHFGEPEFRGFDDEPSARRFEQQLRDDGEICVMLETMPKRISSGTRYRVRTRDGIVSLAEAHPDLAAPIDALAHVVTPYRVYWVPQDTLPDAIRSILRK